MQKNSPLGCFSRFRAAISGTCRVQVPGPPKCARNCSPISQKREYRQPAPPNNPFRDPKYHVIDTIRPLLEVYWGLPEYRVNFLGILVAHVDAIDVRPCKALKRLTP